MSNLVTIEELEGGIALISLNRPEKRNALSIALIESLCAAIKKLEYSRVIVIKGYGTGFCAGMDLAETMDRNLYSSLSPHVERLLLTVHQCHCVTIAAVHGYAVGGGAGLMAACDFVVADRQALIGFPEIHRGLVPAKVLAILKRQMKERDLKCLLLKGNLVSGEIALQMGLVNTLIDGDPFGEAIQLAQGIIKGAPKAIAQTKTLIDHLFGSTLEEDFQTIREHYQISSSHQEMDEGIKAWQEKRNPVW